MYRHLLTGNFFVGGIFCDLQKAFDCVNHSILLAKMSFYGITGIGNKLMKSYLENRYQRVSLNNSKSNKVASKWELTKHGVPHRVLYWDHCCFSFT